MVDNKAPAAPPSLAAITAQEFEQQTAEKAAGPGRELGSDLCHASRPWRGGGLFPGRVDRQTRSVERGRCSAISGAWIPAGTWGGGRNVAANASRRLRRFNLSRHFGTEEKLNSSLPK